MELPKEKTSPSNKMSDYKWLIYGQPGIGKTTFANSFENPLILDLEGGTSHIEGYIVKIGSWNDIREVYSELSKGGHGYKTIVFDTVDVLYQLCLTHACGQAGIEHPSDEGYGKGWQRIRNAIVPMVTAMNSLGLGMVFLSHSQEIEIKTRSKKYNRTTTTMSNAAAKIFVPMVDIMGYCHFDEDEQKERMVTFQGSDYIEAKSRTSSVVTLPAQCALDYKEVSSYFKGEK